MKRKKYSDIRIEMRILIIAMLMEIILLTGAEICSYVSPKGRSFQILLFGTIVLAGLVVTSFIFCIYLPVCKLRDTVWNLEKADHVDAGGLSMNVSGMEASLNRILQERQQSSKREQAWELLQQQSIYAELQSQINPHFLYNTLETIRGQAFVDDNYIIADMTEALAKYFRYNISKDNNFVTVQQELENIRNYVHIQQYRFQNRFDFNISFYEEDHAVYNCQIPKMTIQPIVENAIYHGIEQKLEKGHIRIHVERTAQRLNIVVLDDGAGIDGETLQKIRIRLKEKKTDCVQQRNSAHNGIAMENVNSRLKLLYGEEYGLEISSTLNVGTQVEISLPVIVVKEE